ncbi:MAG: hypothetical protein ACLQBC_02700 [Syntrophales bacterium]
MTTPIKVTLVLFAFLTAGALEESTLAGTIEDISTAKIAINKIMIVPATETSVRCFIVGDIF